MDIDKIQLVTARTKADLQFKVNTLVKVGFKPEGSFNRTACGRWFFQTMVKPDAIEVPAATEAAGNTQATKPSRAKSEAKPNKARKAVKKSTD